MNKSRQAGLANGSKGHDKEVGGIGREILVCDCP